MTDPVVSPVHVLVLKVCCQLLSLLLLIPLFLPLHASTVAETTTSSSSSSTASADNSQKKAGNSNKDDTEQKDMITGLAAGFGFFCGVILCVCLVWCCCCAHVGSEDGARQPPSTAQRAKVSPSPARSAKVRTRSVTCSGP